MGRRDGGSFAMSLRARTLVLPVMMVFPVGGCNDVVDEVAVLVRLAEGRGEGPVAVLEGVEVCETDTTNCVVTDSNGEARLLLPPEEEVSYTVTKEGYEPQLRADVTAEGYTASPRITMWRDELAADWYDTVMSQYPPTGAGTVLLHVGLEGAMLDLVDASGRPFYMVDSTHGSRDLEATTSHGGGGFLEVAPGEFEIEISGSASGCVPVRGWPGEADNRIRFPVRAGYLTSLVVDCEEP